MASDDDIRTRLKMFIQKHATPMQVFSAEVIEVNEEEYTVDVKPPELAEILDVRLKAGIDGFKDGIVEIPKKGSTVLVGVIGGSEEEAYVVKVSEVDKIIVNDGSFGGLIKIEELKSQLEKNSNAISLILDAINNGVPIPQDGGVGFQNTMKALIQSAQVADLSNIEDDKFIH